MWSIRRRTPGGPGRPAEADGSRPVWRLEAHAIVSRDARIADAQGAMPAGLLNPADQVRFQRLLDAATAAVLGRHGHERHPRRAHRRRLVVTSRVAGLAAERSSRDEEASADAAPMVVFWNPEGASSAEALAAIAPRGGSVLVTGGARVFAHFLDHGLDRFDLAVAHACDIPNGVPCVPGIGDLAGLTERLGAAGLVLESTAWLDAQARVELRRYCA